MATFLRSSTAATTSPPTRIGSGLISGSGRQRRTSWVALGVLLVLGAGLGVVLWSSTLTERRTVLVASQQIEPGHRIERSDLREASVNADAAIAAESSTALDQVVGQVAQSVIPSGTPVQRSMLGDVTTVPKGSVVVGASLAAGEYPTSGLRTGDSVTLVETTVGASSAATSKVLAQGTVWAVETVASGGQDRLFISVVVAEEQGATVANAAATNRLRLLLGAPR